MLDQLARLLEPVTAEIGLRFDAVSVVRKNCINIFISKFAPQKFPAQEWRIADDHIALGPFAFSIELERIIGSMFAGPRFFQRFRFAAEMRHKERVIVLEVIEILQDWFFVILKTVVAPPLQITDLYGDLRQLESVGVELDRFQLLHIDGRPEGEAELRSEGDYLLFKIEKQLKRDVKKVAATASGIEHGDRRQFAVEGGELRAIGAAALGFCVRGSEA